MANASDAKRQAEGAESKTERAKRLILNNAPLINEIRELFKAKVPNLNENDLVFATLHPYKRAKDVARLLCLSKVSDRIRKKMKCFFIVKEKNQDDFYHYHLLGYLPKDKMLEMKNFKIWSEKVVEKGMPNYTSQRELYEMFMNDEELSSVDFEQAKKNNTKDIQRAFAKCYCSTKKSIPEQIKYIVSYMCKQESMVKYQTYITVFPP